MYSYKIKRVVKVLDGDTVDVIIDLGFNILHSTRVRLKDIDAPEVRTKDLHEKAAGQRCKDRLIELLGIDPDTCETLREETFLHLITYKTGKYGRWLGSMYRHESDLVLDERSDAPSLIEPMNINERLVTEGFATKYDG